MGVCSITFPGIDRVLSMTYTVQHGHQPGTAYLRIAPQASLPTLRGTLSFTDGITSVSLTNCLIDQTGFEFDERGFVQTVPIKDYRWMWQDAIIIGSWNVRRPDQSIDVATERTPRQLLALLYNAMGATVDVSGMPNSDRPMRVWEGQKAWSEAEKLLAEYNCALAPDFTTNATRVYRLGVGATLPVNTHLQGANLGASYDPVPDAIRLYAGETVYQGRIKLYPVALETDGSVLLAEDVSYKPEREWTSITNPLDLIPTASATDYKLANKTVGYWFQIGELVGGASVLHLPDGNTVDSIQHILPLRRRILEQYVFDGNYYESPPRVHGTFWTGGEDLDSLENTPPFTELEEPFEIDYELGIIKFRSPVWKKAADGTWAFPDLYLTAGYHRLDNNKQFHQHYLERTLGSYGTPTSGKTAESLYRAIVGVYDGATLTATIDNQAVLEARMNVKLDDWENSFAVQSAGYNRYRGIQPIGLSGQIRAVTFTVHKDRGAHTIGVQNSSCMMGVKGIRQRRREANSEPMDREDVRRERRKRRGDD